MLICMYNVLRTICNVVKKVLTEARTESTLDSGENQWDGGSREIGLRNHASITGD